MIIGVNGLKRSGKDTIGEYLESIHGYSRISFAAPLKRVCETYFDASGIAEDQREEEREFLIRELSISRAANSLGFPSQDIYKFRERFHAVFDQYAILLDDTYSKYKMTYRQMLQLFGTEVCRYFKDDIWISLAAQQIKQTDNVVITDVRFDNEASMIQELGGIIVEVNRDGVKSDGHISENRLTFSLIDYSVNNTTFEELFNQVENILIINK